MSSNPNDRPLKVMTFLASHPMEVFTLAEIRSRLEISKGSAQRVLSALTERGFVSRHPRHKTYSLGLSLIAIGNAALERYSGIERARQEILHLSAELKVGFGITAIVNKEYILLCREGAPKAYDGHNLVGERRFLCPPIGIGQMSWRSQIEVEAYFDDAGSYMTPALREYMRGACEIIRKRGYSMAANGVFINKLMSLAKVPEEKFFDDLSMDLLGEDYPDIPYHEFQLMDWSDVSEAGVNYIAAPVFSSEGEVSFEIVMSGFPNGVSRDQYRNFAQKLKAVAEGLTKENRGRKPDDSLFSA